MTMITKCAECGGQLVPAPTGRPARFCSTGCRRATEYRVTLTKRHIARLHEQLSAARIEDALEGEYGNQRRRQRHMEVLTNEIETAEARLRELLDDDAEDEA